MTESSNGLSIRLFGPLEVWVYGAPARGLRERQNAARLLAVLALRANTPVSNEWVATRIWPETGSVDSLGHEVPLVRAALGPYGCCLTAKAGSLCLDLRGASVDVLEMGAAWEAREQDPARLRGALELYRGPLLEDWYDDWVEQERAEHRARYVRGLRWLAEHALTAGRLPEAKDALGRLLRAGEASATLHASLMAALMKEQQYAEAKRLYDEYRDELRERHQVLPPARMTALYEHIPRITPAVVPEVEQARLDLEPAGGAMPLSSRFYIQRPADRDLHAALARRDGVVLIRGPRQVGKTSLLARGLEHARQNGALVLVTDFQKLPPEHIGSLSDFFLVLARHLQKRLKLPPPEESWEPLQSPNANFEEYVRARILEKTALPVVWGIDEADSIFDRDYRGSVFGLFRAWFNERSLDPSGPWTRFTLILTYSTEAYLFIPSLNQSPFNVGTRITLEDFTPTEVAELNARYGSPLSNKAELERLYRLVGGHPYLVRRCLNELKAHGMNVEELEAEACRDGGLFSDHLARLDVAIRCDNSLKQALAALVEGKTTIPQEPFSRLCAAGIVTGPAANNVRLRCGLYESYLRGRMTDDG